MQAQHRLKSKIRKIERNIQVMKKLQAAGRIKEEFAKTAVKKQEKELNQLKEELEVRSQGLLTYNPFAGITERMK